MRYENVCIEALRYELPSQSLQTSAIEGALSGLYGRMGIRPGWLEAVTGRLTSLNCLPADTRPPLLSTCGLVPSNCVFVTRILVSS